MHRVALTTLTSCVSTHTTHAQVFTDTHCQEFHQAKIQAAATTRTEVRPDGDVGICRLHIHGAPASAARTTSPKLLKCLTCLPTENIPNVMCVGWYVCMCRQVIRFETEYGAHQWTEINNHVVLSTLDTHQIHTR